MSFDKLCENWDDLLEDDYISPIEYGFVKGCHISEVPILVDKFGRRWPVSAAERLPTWMLDELEIVRIR